MGHFLHLAQKALHIGEIAQFELEHMFLMPRASALLATLMTSLLSSPNQRVKVSQIKERAIKRRAFFSVVLYLPIFLFFFVVASACRVAADAVRAVVGAHRRPRRRVVPHLQPRRPQRRQK